MLFRVENIFLLSAMVFLGTKLLSLPTVYPLIAILPFLLQKDLIKKITAQKYLILTWIFLAAYALLILPKFINPWMLTAFFVIPIYFLAITQLKANTVLNRTYLNEGFFWISLLFTTALVIGIILHLDNIKPLWNWSHISSGFLRKDDSLRLEIFNALLPWDENIEGKRAYLSLLGILLTAFALIGPTGKKGITAFTLLTCLNIFAISRTPLLASFGILVLSWLATSRLKIKLLIASLIALTPVILSLDALTLNGRRPIWDSILQNIDWRGHGIGAAAFLTEEFCRTTGKNPIIIYPHNIHLETMYDWGWPIYAVFLLSTVYFLFKKNAVRTSFVLFFILAINYSIFSPWSSWFLLFAFWQDQATLSKSSFVRNDGKKQQPN